jgi:hypothetical protein
VGRRCGVDDGGEAEEVLRRTGALGREVDDGEEEGRTVLRPHDRTDHCGGLGAVGKEGGGDAVAVGTERLYRAVGVVEEGDAAAPEAVGARRRRTGLVEVRPARRGVRGSVACLDEGVEERSGR